MMRFDQILLLIGTIWPPIGFVLGVMSAFLFSHWKRWLVLIVGPLLFVSPCLIFFQPLASDGNMLFVALMIIVYLMGLIYYTVLLVTGIVLIIRKKQNHSY